MMMCLPATRDFAPLVPPPAIPGPDPFDSLASTAEQLTWSVTERAGHQLVMARKARHEHVFVRTDDLAALLLAFGTSRAR